MKKVFAIMAMAAMFAACNSSDTSADDAAKKAADSTRMADSMANVQKMEQGKMAPDSNSMKMTDSSKMKMPAADSSKKKSNKMQKK